MKYNEAKKYITTLICTVTLQNIYASNVPEIQFETPLTLREVLNTLQIDSAIQIMNSLFYIAIAIGGINVVRTFVFHPDKSKRAAINYVASILIYSVVTMFLGLY